MQQTAWDQDLLDWLAQDLAAHHYDLKQTMERILTSRAYQLPAVDSGEQQDDELCFHRPGRAAHVGRGIPRRPGLLDRRGLRQRRTRTSASGDRASNKSYGPQKTAKWIWNDPGAANNAKAGRHLRCAKRFTLPQLPDEAEALVCCDNSFELFVNGHKAGAGNDSSKPFMIDLNRG